MDVDLHIHSTSSDGTVRPSGVVRRAVAAGLDLVALTDHDTVAGVAEAMAAVGSDPVEVVPGIELSSSWRGRDIHILGYFVDPEAPALLRHEERAREGRRGRLEEMVRRLDSQGMSVPFDDVLAVAGEGAGSLGRPHLARALVDRGHANSVPDAFDRLIGDEHPAFVPTELLSPAEAVDVVRAAGGVSIWAHPPLDLLDQLLPELRAAGLGGLEVYRPRVSEEKVRRLEAAARAMGLMVSGGSDWHGPDDGELGEFRVSSSEIGALLEAGGL